MSFYPSQPNPSQHGTHQTRTSGISSRTGFTEQNAYSGTPQGQFLDPAPGNPGFPFAESHPSRSPTLGGYGLQPGQSETISTHDGGGGAVQHSRSRQTEAGYTIFGDSESRYSGQTPAYPAGAPTFDSTYPGPPYQSHINGANASTGSRSHQLYQTGAPGTRINPEPRYPGVPPTGLVQEQRQGQGQGLGGVSVGGGGGRGRGRAPVRQPTPPPTCRMPKCDRPEFFDRRFNEFWEWCSPQHIDEALRRGIEKVCKHCAVWPRRLGYSYCGGDRCNKHWRI